MAAFKLLYGLIWNIYNMYVRETTIIHLEITLQDISVANVQLYWAKSEDQVHSARIFLSLEPIVLLLFSV